MSARPLPPIEFLRECFRYDPETGRFWWRQRPEHHFTDAIRAQQWNTRHAGKATMRTRDGSGYLKCEVDFFGSRRRLLAARVAFKLLTGEEPECVDHKNGSRIDNSYGNLRGATAQQNQANTKGRAAKPLPKGVFFEGSRFIARAYDEAGRKVFLGSYAAPKEAKAAYDAHMRSRHPAHFNPGPAKPSVFD